MTEGVGHAQRVAAHLKRAAKGKELAVVRLSWKHDEELDVVEDWLTNEDDEKDGFEKLSVLVEESAVRFAKGVGVSRVSFVLAALKKDETQISCTGMRVEQDLDALQEDVTKGDAPRAGTTTEAMAMLLTHMQVRMKLDVGAELRQQRVYEGIISVLQKQIADLTKELTSAYRLLKDQAETRSEPDPEVRARAAAWDKVATDASEMLVPLLVNFVDAKTQEIGNKPNGKAKTDGAASTDGTPAS